MTLMRSGASGRLWREFQVVFSEFSGISVQTFDASGKAIQPSPVLPSLCAFLQRQPETLAACQKDCYREAGNCGDSRRTLSARCYAGLSYRIVPIRHLGKAPAVILVGRVLTEVLGEEQRRGFIARHRLDPMAFLESQGAVSAVASSELDRVASLVRTLAVSVVAAEAKAALRHRLLARRDKLLALARLASVSRDRDSTNLRAVVRALADMFSVPGVAVLLPLEAGAGFKVAASLGIGEEGLSSLSGRNWQRVLETPARGPFFLLSGREAMIRAGLDAVGPALAVQRLTHGPRTVGYLALAGRALPERDQGLLRAAAAFVASRIVADHLWETAARHEEGAALLGRLAEQCLSARDIDEVLPLALESAMHGLRSRRGSILLAEERGQIVACALRGDHAPVSRTIDRLSPDSISHRVFFERQPLLVRDIDQQPHLKRAREYPYASHSFVSVPLRENGHSVGVLHLTEREGDEPFTPRDLAWLERLGLQASAAIRKIRLEKEVEELRVASTVDHLTGAHNRRYLEEHLAIELRRLQRTGKPLAIAMLDLDGFKALNEELGHDVGDRVLKQVAVAVGGQLRAIDVIARYGGDEFVLILPGTDEAGAAVLAERIRTGVVAAQLPGPAPRHGSITVSLGIAVCQDAAESADELLQRADFALSEAKRSGRNTVLLWRGAVA